MGRPVQGLTLESQAPGRATAAVKKNQTKTTKNKKPPPTTATTTAIHNKALYDLGWTKVHGERGFELRSGDLEVDASGYYWTNEAMPQNSIS